MLPLLIDFLGVGSSKCLPQVSISGSKDMKTNVESFEGTDNKNYCTRNIYSEVDVITQCPKYNPGRKSETT